MKSDVECVRVHICRYWFVVSRYVEFFYLRIKELLFVKFWTEKIVFLWAELLICLFYFIYIYMDLKVM